MYPFFLSLHSWLRWAVLLLGLWALFRAYAGLAGHRPWTPRDNAVAKWFVVCFDVQFLVGLILYAFLSPITMQALTDMGAAMRNAEARFWAVEHVAMMVLALVFAHIGRARARRAATDAARHRSSAIFYTLAVIAILAAVPWPFLSHARPLFRFVVF